MIEEPALRTFAIVLVEFACGRFTGGRSEDDPIYREVTENRDVGAARRSYSSCGDLAHWLLYRLGCRSKIVNRAEHQGFGIGKNVSRLAFDRAARNPRPDDVYRAGDILIIWSREDTTDAHVMVALEHDPAAAPPRLRSGEYGQPGGAVRDHALVEPLMIGRRKIQRVIPLLSVLGDAEAREQLVEPDYAVLPRAQAYALEHRS